MDDGHGVADAVRGGGGLVVEMRELIELGFGQEVVVQDGGGKGRVRGVGGDGEEGAEGGTEVVEAAGEEGGGVGGGAVLVILVVAWLGVGVGGGGHFI